MGSTGAIGIIAGLGDLPVEIARRAKAGGRDVFVLRLRGFEEPRLRQYSGEVVGMGEVGKQISLLKKAGCSDIVFAGIVKRPDFKALKLDLRGASLLPKVIMEAKKGDDALLRVMVRTMEGEGFRVIGADQAVLGLTEVEPGQLTPYHPDDGAQADIRVAARVAREIGRLDIGQGCVVCHGLVLAVEAQEGTDEMLRRVAELPAEIRGSPSRRAGVLVKRPKPIQERRIDMPTIGPRTIELAAAAGLAGVAVEAGGALILDREALIELASEHGLFVAVYDANLDPMA